jgi:SAM-dependent methyltransferase
MTDFWTTPSQHLARPMSLVLSRRRENAVNLPDQITLPDKITIRPVLLKGRVSYQWALRSGTKELHENLTEAETAARVRLLFGPVFADAHLFTSEADYSARYDTQGELTLRKSPATKNPQITTHDRPKAYLIPEDVPCPFLAEIGVMTSAGRVKQSKYAKFRQINRFLELVDDISAALPAGGTLNVVDFGCGKSYLTFALHHLLTQVHGRSVRILGLDRNADVVRSCQTVAEHLGLNGVEFRVGDIATCDVDFQVDLAVSLHACDTATDDARAVDWQASVILSVPCCQHELAEKLHAPLLEHITQHGILKERFAALATDALRASILEQCGYKVQVVEFIDMEHTPKNLLIRAVRRPQTSPIPAEAAASYTLLKKTLGIERLHLEDALGTTFRNSIMGQSDDR